MTTMEMKQNDILLDCYQQFEKQYESNNFQFDINLSQTIMGPIELSTSEKKGRCWRATKQITAGQIILIEKAFVFSSRTQHRFNNLFRNLHSIKQDQDDLIFDETAILISQLIETKSNNLDDLANLFPLANDIHSMDTFEAEEYGICSAHDVWLYNHYLSRLAQDKHSSTLVKRVPYVVYYNAMAVTQNIEQLCYFSEISNSSSFSEMTGDAIYLKGSFFNHHCKPNLNRYFVGDILIVTATKSIAVGEELTFSYLESEYLSESERFRANRLCFVCNCCHCINQRGDEAKTDDDDDESDEESNDDVQIFDDVRCEQMMCCQATQRIVIIDELMKRNDIRFVDVISGYSAKAMAFLQLKQYQNASHCWMKCVESIKENIADVHENMVPFYVQNILCKVSQIVDNKMDNEEDIIQLVKNNKEIMKLMKDMIQIHDICFAGGAILFLKRYCNELSFSAYPAASKRFQLWNSILLSLEL